MGRAVRTRRLPSPIHPCRSWFVRAAGLDPSTKQLRPVGRILSTFRDNSPMSAKCFFVRRKIAALLASTWIGVALAGCGEGRGPGAKDFKVDASVAKQSLTAALDAWKAGEKAASLQQRQPPIVAIDTTWNGGAKLLDYKILSDKDGSANMYYQVELSIDQEGQPSTQTASYVVSTSPAITVSRDDE